MTLLCLLLSPGLDAYGPRSVTAMGHVVKWSLPVRIDLECDLDVRGKDVTALIDEGLSRWADLSESNLSYDRQRLGVDVNADNVCCYLYDSSACPSGPRSDGKNPIVIDDDGTVVAKFFGTGNQFVTLGFAAIVTFDSSTGAAAKGEAVFNAACLQGVAMEGCQLLGLSFSDDDFTSFIVHEIGHFLGLNHSQVNLDEADDADTSNDDKITTMYSFFIQGNGANFKTPERDDAMGLAFLYPEESFAGSTFTVSGTVRDDDGTSGFACANLVARNTDPNQTRTDAISFVSGQLCPNGVFDDSCDGDYSIQGLNPSQSYTVEVEPIDASFRNSSGIPPCEGSGQQPTFDEQTYNSNVNTGGGSTVSGIDFTLANTSGNVNSLSVGGLDNFSLAGFDAASVEERILEVELKTETDSCVEADGSCENSSSSGSGGCVLIPR